MFPSSASNHIQNHISGKPHESDGKRKRSNEVKYSTARRNTLLFLNIPNSLIALSEPVSSLVYSTLPLPFSPVLVVSARMRMMCGQNIAVLQVEHTFTIRSLTSLSGRDQRDV